MAAVHICENVIHFLRTTGPHMSDPIPDLWPSAVYIQL